MVYMGTISSRNTTQMAFFSSIKLHINSIVISVELNLLISSFIILLLFIFSIKPMHSMTFFKYFLKFWL
jgi:hypothetical protein